MFQKTKQLCRKAFGFVNGIPTKVMMFSFMLLSGMVAKAQNSAGDYSAGTSALSTVADEIAKYVPIMVKLCYAIAGVVAIVGAISVYIAMSADGRSNTLSSDDFPPRSGIHFNASGERGR